MTKPDTTSDRLDDISIWIEANRDTTPARWSSEVWPEIEKRIKAHLATEKAQLLERVEAEVIGGDEGDIFEHMKPTYQNELRANQRLALAKLKKEM